MELRHLRYFLTVAEEEHITRAAERLGIQQPPLSQQIRALESELDVQLLRRKPRGVALTEAGRTFAEDARKILESVDLAVARAQRTGRGQQGQIVVGFTSSVPFLPFVPEVIRSFGEDNPKVTISLEEGGTAELVEAIRAEQMDAAFVRSPVGDVDGIATYPLFREPMIAALPSRHPLASAREPLALSDMQHEPFILYRRQSGPGLYDTIIAACHRAGFTPRIGQEAPRIVATLNLVAAGLGVTIVAECLQTMHMDGVTFRALKADAELFAPLTLACRTVDHSEVAKRFVALVRRTSASLQG